jgi:hypothetical protein
MQRPWNRQQLIYPPQEIIYYKKNFFHILSVKGRFYLYGCNGGKPWRWDGVLVEYEKLIEKAS